MKLENQKQADVMSLGDSESIEMGIDMSNMKLLMEMFSKNIYSDAIGSTVRETVSNALDSSRRAGSNEPVIVSLNPIATGEYEYSVEDFGLGLDDEDVQGTISKYMASTKRGDNLELGMYGIGFKSPLAYTSSFTFICRKDGMERKYMMYEGEEINSIDLLDESPTDKVNGVKVIVPVKYSDRSSFVMKIKEQLAYFDNVWFDVNIQNPSYDYQRSEYAPKTISNDFVIHRSESFQWSEMSADKSLHLCLDNVYYPLDFDKLGIDRINVPVALRFTLEDGLFPTINREAIRYTPETKSTILGKLKKVADYFMEKYNETITEADDLQQVINYYKSNERKVELEGQNFYVESLIKHSDIDEKEPKLKGVELLNLKRLSKDVNSLFTEYKVRFAYSNNRLSSVSQYIRFSDFKSFPLYRFDETFKGNKRLYVRDIIPERTRIIKKTESLKLKIKKDYWERDGYYQILKLEKYPREQWRQVIKEFQFLRDSFVNKLQNIDDIDIPQSWLDARKKKRQYVSVAGQKKLKAKGEINAKQAENLLRYNDGKNCKFTSQVFKLEDFEKYKGLTVYGCHEDRDKLDRLYKLYKGLRLLTFSQRELKNIEKLEVHNLISYEEFMKGKNMVFKRMVTAHLIYQLCDRYSSVFNRLELLNSLSKDLAKKLERLKNYKSKYHNHSYGINNSGYDAIVKIAEDYSLFDMSIYGEYLEMKKFLEENKYINTITSQVRYSTEEEWKDILRDILKYHKVRLSYTNYKLNKEPLWIEKEEEVNN